MRRLVALAVLFVVLLVLPSRAADEEYLDVARATARYLRSIAVDEGDRGLSWPMSNIVSARQTGMDAGAAGIGTFFLALFEATREPEHLVVAERASAFVFSEYRRRGPNGPDWLAGAAGGGEFALRLFTATGRASHLADAQWAADWLVRNATREGDTAHWRFATTPRIYTGRYHGAAGNGLFLLDIYEATGDGTYLSTAQAAGRWLQQHVVPFSGDAIGWKRLTTDVDAYHGWCGGSTGIMAFLARLADVSRDERYRDLYRRTADGLLQHARSQREGVAWPYYSSASTSYPVIFCHGASSTAVALYDAWQVAGDSRYLQAARSAAAWTISVGRTLEGGRFWPHIDNWEQFETGYQTGAASIGHALLRMHAVDPHEPYLEQARRAAAYLTRIADRPAEGQVRWINYTNPERPDWRHEFGNGWYSGAAGIGIFFLELDAAVRLRR